MLPFLGHVSATCRKAMKDHIPSSFFPSPRNNVPFCCVCIRNKRLYKLFHISRAGNPVSASRGETVSHFSSTCFRKQQELLSEAEEREYLGLGFEAGP